MGLLKIKVNENCKFFKRIHKKTNKENFPEKQPLDAETDISAIRASVKDSVNRLNSEISINDPSYIYLKHMNSMYQLFDNTFAKNIILIDHCKEINFEIVENANKISEVISETNNSQDTLKSLNEDYEKVLKIATVKRDNLIENNLEISKLKNQIIGLKQTLQFNEKSAVESQSKLVIELQNDISKLNLELTQNKKTIDNLLMDYEYKSGLLNDIQIIIKSHRAETEKTDKILSDVSRKKSDLHESNLDLQKQIEEIEATIPDYEKDEYQRKKSEKISGFKVLENILTDLKAKIIIMRNEVDDRLVQISKKTKVFKKIKEDNEYRTKLYNEKNREITEREKQLEPYLESITILNKERNDSIPEYNETVKKYQDVQKEKSFFRQRSKSLQNELFETNCIFSKSESGRLQEVRTNQQEKSEIDKIGRTIQRESNKALEISKEAGNSMGEIFVTVQKVFDLKMFVKTIQDEADDKIVETKFYSTNLLVEKEIFKTNMQRIEKMNEKLQKSHKKKEKIDQKCQILREERNTYHKNFEVVRSEHGELVEKYNELAISIENMTHRTETLVNDTVGAHFLRAENKAAIVHLAKMRKKAEKGIKLTNKVTFDLSGEIQTLKKIVDQTALDHISQKKEMATLKNSRRLILNQLHQTVKEINERNNEILTQNQLLKKGEYEFDVVMKKIFAFQNEIENCRQKTLLLTAKVEKMKDLKENKRRLEANLMIKKCQTTALFQESKIRVNFHRWYELSAFDSEQLFRIKFFQKLKNDLLQKSDELKSLIIERDELKAKVYRLRIPFFDPKKMDQYDNELDSFFITKPPNFCSSKTENNSNIVGYSSNSEIVNEIELTKQQLKEKGEKIQELRELIKSQVVDLNENKNIVKSVRSSVNERRSKEFQLKFENEKIEKANLIENEKMINDQQFVFKVKEPPTNKPMLGGGFRPRPPKEPKSEVVPRMDFRNINSFQNEENNEANFKPMAPVSAQRSRRPDVKSLRKKLLMVLDNKDPLKSKIKKKDDKKSSDHIFKKNKKQIHNSINSNNFNTNNDDNRFGNEDNDNDSSSRNYRTGRRKKRSERIRKGIVAS